MERFNLYKRLRAAGLPQGGAGIWMNDPDSNDRVYIPTPSELYTTFIADPADWNDLCDAMAEVWLEKRHGHNQAEKSS